jgi:hypothetical protein
MIGPWAVCAIVSGQVFEFEDRDEWIDAVGAFVTIGFTEVPNGTFVTDEYLPLGVLFTDGIDIALCCGSAFPNDGAGLDGEGPIHLSFTAPQASIAIDFPGPAAIQLYRDGEQFYESDEFGGSGLNHFAGLVSYQPFDQAVVFRFYGYPAFIDDLHFGPPICPADLDPDRIVGIADLLLLLAAWGTDAAGPPDLDGDGLVGIQDLLELLARWGPCPPFALSFPFGRPNLIHPAGQALSVLVTELGDSLDPGSPTLHSDAGEGTTEVALTQVGTGIYQGEFPPASCGEVVAFYLTARGEGGAVVSAPPSAPEAHFVAASAAGRFVRLDDDAEEDAGWEVGGPDDDATGGTWERVDPEGTAAQPEHDHTSGPGKHCWVTGQALPGDPPAEGDVDGGRTTLISPVFDLADADTATISYWRWFSNDTGPAPGEDLLLVEISNDGGATWTEVETVGPTGIQSGGGWFQHLFEVAEVLAPTADMRLRFVASDEGADSTVEAAIDDLVVAELCCTSSLEGDLDGDGEVGISDLLELLCRRSRRIRRCTPPSRRTVRPP